MIYNKNRILLILLIILIIVITLSLLAVVYLDNTGYSDQDQFVAEDPSK